MKDDLVFRAMRLAERAHRGQERRAPEGEYRPSYFLHLAEVGWMLQETGAAPAVVAAGFLHDVIEDCGYVRERLQAEIGGEDVAKLVEWVSVRDEGMTWRERNQLYRERMMTAPMEAVMISCADKTSNLMAAISLLGQGHPVESFLRENHETQLAKFEALDMIFRDKVPRTLYNRFAEVLHRFKNMRGGCEDHV